MTTPDFAKEILLQKGFSFISGGLFQFVNNNGQATVNIGNEFIKCDWKQKNKIQDVVFIEYNKVSDLFHWADFYVQGKTLIF